MVVLLQAFQLSTVMTAGAPAQARLELNVGENDAVVEGQLVI